MSNEAFLKTVSIFSSLSEADRRLLASQLEEVEFKAGARIVNEDEPSDCLFIVKEGFVNVVRNANGKQDVFLTMLIAGDYFGEAALFENLSRTASVLAAENARLLKITKKSFDQFLQDNPLASNRVLYEMLRQVFVRLSQTSRDLQFVRSSNATLSQGAIDKLFI